MVSRGAAAAASRLQHVLVELLPVSQQFTDNRVTSMLLHPMQSWVQGRIQPQRSSCQKQRRAACCKQRRHRITDKMRSNSCRYRHWCGSLHTCRAAQEPENAHSHLLSMVLGNSETVPVSNGQLCIGTWQVRHACCFSIRAVRIVECRAALRCC
jgi:hypothetical protein